jgi:hypothetical protein
MQREVGSALNALGFGERGEIRRRRCRWGMREQRASGEAGAQRHDTMTYRGSRPRLWAGGVPMWCGCVEEMTACGRRTEIDIEDLGKIRRVGAEIVGRLSWAFFLLPFVFCFCISLFSFFNMTKWKMFLVVKDIQYHFMKIIWNFYEMVSEQKDDVLRIYGICLTNFTYYCNFLFNYYEINVKII